MVVKSLTAAVVLGTAAFVTTAESTPSPMEVARLVAGLLSGGARDPGAPTAEESFRLLETGVERSVFLVHSSFAYETKDLDGTWVRHTSSTWGTAFVVHQDGWLLTNKHLVAPWKFDAELCGLASTKDARILPDTSVITVWPAGTHCLDERRQPILSTGYSTLTGSLRLALEAPDSLVAKASEDDTSVRMHALDNADLAILKLDASDYPALTLANDADEAKLTKLVPVMTIGFPRGNGGLEAEIAETSASTGVLRKAEATLHVTTPIVAGNSGGPLMTPDGRVIGIATRIFSETLGIGIRIRHARALLDQAIKQAK